MATRFRLTNAGTPVPAPAFQSYTHTTSAVRRPLLQATDASALATVATAPDAADHLSAGDALHRQFISEQLGAQTFTSGDAVKFALQGLEAHANNNLAIQLFIGVINLDGTAAATIRSKVSEGTELGTAIANRFLSTTLSATHAATDGQRLVIEFSVVGTPGPAASGVQGHNASMRWGCAGAGGDLPEDDTATGATLNPWIEFANTILFRPKALAMVGVGG